MRHSIFVVLMGMVPLFAQQTLDAKSIKLSQKGERIVNVLCDFHKLPSAKGEIESVMERLATSNACRPLSKSKREAVAYYLKYGKTDTHKQHIAVPEDAKCPVCGMFVSKYPKWAAMMEVNGHIHYFDGVKDMMKYYIFDGDFPYDRKTVSKMTVSDYYTLKAIPAKAAWYVVDPDVFGPMGHELVPFESQKEAKTFMQEHHGKAIVRFHEITDTMVMALDGITQ
ncbi:MAG: nitrous oxide reductase accessory protein NosL [Sulfurovum sp.]|nr:nitrous oxide reductase accessory protein NosL [Sulfurovum sp.]